MRSLLGGARKVRRKLRTAVYEAEIIMLLKASCLYRSTSNYLNGVRESGASVYDNVQNRTKPVNLQSKWTALRSRAEYMYKGTSLLHLTR